MKRERPVVRYTHGGRQNPTWVSWSGMMYRCYFKSYRRAYALYGGRGIRVEKRWHKFENFLRDMGERPEGCSIDRINPDGHYERGNCRWATDWEQSQNRRGKKAVKTSPFVGVYWMRETNRWATELRFEGKQIFRKYGKGGDRSIEEARRLFKIREEYVNRLLLERPELESFYRRPTIP